MEISVDAGELVRWHQGFAETPKLLRSSIARALNSLGGDLVNSLSSQLSDTSGLPVAEVRKAFKITRATASSLVWELDAHNLLTAKASRPGAPQRKFTQRTLSQFPPGLLVDVITAGDVRMGEGAGARLVEVCEICIEKAEEGPYTIEDVRAMGATWSHFAATSPGVTNLFHPNCRCTVWPRNTRASQITYRPRARPQSRVKPFEGKMPEVITYDEFANRIGEVAEVTVRAILKG